MKYQNSLKWLIPPIFILTLLAALAGLWPAAGSSYPVTTFRGEEVMINARGLYYWDTLSSAAQMQVNDLVTLVLGLPLLAVSFWMSLRGSLRGRLILAGTLGFILYTYISMCFGTHYNQLFLVYVTLFSLSLFAFILSLMSFDLPTLPGHFSENLPRGWIAGFLFAAAAFLILAWLGRIAGTFAPGAVPALENTTSMFIQALDLGLIAPACVLSGVLLLWRSAWGYLLTAVGLAKFVTLGISVSLMGLNMARVGVPDSAALVGIFGLLAITGVVMALILFRSISETATK